MVPSVTLDAAGDAVVDGVVIEDALLDAEAAAMLALAASADGTACASVVASSTGGDTSVAVTVTIEVCAEVTAITDGTITLGGVTFAFAGAGVSSIEVGDEVCVAATSAGSGAPIITEIDGEVAGGGGGGAGPTALPDTASGEPFVPVALGSLLLIAAGIGGSAARRSEVRAR